MAKINDNLFVKGARGHVGKQLVYKKRGNDTLIARMPKVDDNTIATADPEQVRERFAAASRYATGAINDPVLKREYQEKTSPSNTAYNIAFRDYLKAPVVMKIEAGRYDGTIGSTIEVLAKDDFRVAEVRVSIVSSTVLVEEGAAVLHPVDRNKWIYTATVANANLAGTVITVIALDIPGNKGMKEITL